MTPPLPPARNVAPPASPPAPHHAGAPAQYGPQYAPQAHSLAQFAVAPAQTHASPSPPAPRGRVLTPYVTAWSLLGTVAIGYIATALMAPDVLNSARNTQVMAPVAGDLAGEVGTLKESVAQVQLDLAKIKTEIETDNARDKTVAAQVAALETRLSAPAGAIDATTPAAPDDPSNKEGGNVEAGAGSGDGGTSRNRTAGTPQQPKLVNAEDISLDANTLETGSVSSGAAQAGAKVAKDAAAAKDAAQAKDAAKKGAIDFGTAVVKPAPQQPLGIQLSTGASVDSLRLSWSLLSDRHSAALKDLEARYISSGDINNPTYELIAGPLKSKSEAQKVCKALAAKNIPCKIGDFYGAAL